MQTIFLPALPLKPNKLEGPSTCLFLGIEVDMISQQLRPPVEKIERLEKELRAGRTMLKWELQNLLQHACKVI